MRAKAKYVMKESTGVGVATYTKAATTHPPTWIEVIPVNGSAGFGFKSWDNMSLKK